MKISELPVGNWVLYKDTPVQIDSCCPAVDQVGFYFNGNYEFSYIKDLKPMPLTDKIFEANYAVKHYYEEYSETWSFPGVCCYLEKIDGTDHWDLEQYGNAIEIRYVHELQNLLRLFKNWNQEFKIE